MAAFTRGPPLVILPLPWVIIFPEWRSGVVRNAFRGAVSVGICLLERKSRRVPDLHDVQGRAGEPRSGGRLRQRRGRYVRHFHAAAMPWRTGWIWATCGAEDPG